MAPLLLKKVNCATDWPSYGQPPCTSIHHSVVDPINAVPRNNALISLANKVRLTWELSLQGESVYTAVHYINCTDRQWATELEVSFCSSMQHWLTMTVWKLIFRNYLCLNIIQTTKSDHRFASFSGNQFVTKLSENVFFILKILWIVRPTHS